MFARREGILARASDVQINPAMKYYVLKNSTGDDIGNVTGIQIKGRSFDYPYNDQSSYQHLSNLTPARITPNFDYLIVEPKAIMTDFISCTGIIHATGFIVSEKSKKLLEQFKLMPHHFYPVRLLHKTKFYDYHWLHLEHDYINDIDYNKSAFITKKPSPWNIPNWDEEKTSVNIRSIENMISVRKENAGIRTIEPSFLHLANPLVRDLNLFAFSSFGDDNVIISEKLKDAIDEFHLSGTEIIALQYPVSFA